MASLGLPRKPSTRACGACAAFKADLASLRHIKIIEAVRAMDGTVAEQFVREHILAFQQTLASTLIR